MIDARILVVDDNKSVLSALELLLQFEFSQVRFLSNPNQLSTFPGLEEMDIILLDMNFTAGVNTGNEGIFWLREIRKRAPHTSVIMMTAYGAVDLAVDALKQGAVDFVLKPWNNDKLMATIKAAYRLRKSEQQVQELRTTERNLKQLVNKEELRLIGNSQAMNRVLKLVRKVAATDANVLITGENGTGKELIARELHRQSGRAGEVFIGVDLGSLTDSLLESELFGHVKGAFTDAREDRVGKFEAAHKGTLFLDEIGNLSLPAQSKLLSAIQNKIIVRVGSNRQLPVDIRLICATNCNLPRMKEEGRFREDLLYRINTIEIELPPLRERGNDILLLAESFLNRFARKYGKPGLKLTKEAGENLLGHSWPGNVRELQHTMERAVILAENGHSLDPDHLVPGRQANLPEPEMAKTLEEMEQRMITRALDRHQGNHSAAAKQLGISRQTLYNKLKK